MNKISGIAHVWAFSAVPAPHECFGIELKHGDNAAPWFQGRIFEPDSKQYSILGVPAQSPPPVHACMVSEHERPTFYDIYVAEYTSEGPILKICALNVERHSGSGDAIELSLEGSFNESPMHPSNVAFAQRLKLTTTKMLAGNHAQRHLEKYAPGCVNSDGIVCLGIAFIE
ncbi:hypothetical protein LPJ79_004911 [Coemansia sp. RSA 1821]|nr:hypothetical protein LPJ68_004645 [Coemansia sp. RSA 1086]KAJ1747930.1 hypothetical protein LPJ79_004911 [Coemansia sp. RSA 1821]